MTYVIIEVRNTNAINWSDSEESSHICLYVCALFLGEKMEDKILKCLISEALIANKKDESPISALITVNGKIIAKAHNKRNHSHKTTDHAEIIAINKANKVVKDWRLNKCTLYVTIEPCEMCKSVIKESRIQKVYFLLERSKKKKQYNKVLFEQIDVSKYEKTTNLYKKIIQNFWQNKR